MAGKLGLPRNLSVVCSREPRLGGEKPKRLTITWFPRAVPFRSDDAVMTSVTSNDTPTAEYDGPKKYSPVIALSCTQMEEWLGGGLIILFQAVIIT